ncbi:MAG: molecular chaperone DnaJ [Candidatus Cloacimonadota bacterium]|nr:MAG: molecular chaperone DnaJ [Candidatus Cloacimonadota bacterium]
MSEKDDFYSTLGVAKGATESEIKKSYRKAAMKYHPDRNQGDKGAEEKFKSVQEAYGILSDPQKRAAYDQYGHQAFNGGAGGGFNSGFSDFGDIFEGFFGGSFGDMFGGGGQRTNRPRRGKDVPYQMDLSFEQAVFGYKTEISLPRIEECNTCGGRGAVNREDVEGCPICKGQGQIHRSQGIFSVATTCHHCHGGGKIIKKPCHKCNGKGESRKTSKLSVSIPAGVDEGFRIKLRGEGEAGAHGGPKGDLYLIIRVEEHEFFERDGLNIYLSQPISFPQAALGCSIKIPTLTGHVKLSVPAGTDSAQRFRIRGEGVSDVHGRSKGDQIVEIKVMTPKKLDARQKELLKEFSELSGDHLETKGFFDKVKDFIG